MSGAPVLTRRLLGWAFVAYAVLCLGSMATMSIGAGLLLGALILDTRGGPDAQAMVHSAIRSADARRLGLAAVALFGALATSLLAGAFFPLIYGEHRSEVYLFTELGKAWYLAWPFVLFAGLQRLSEVQRRRTLQAWLFAFAVFSAIGWVQHFTGWPRPQDIPGMPGRYHATLFLGHHLSVASIVIFPFFVSLGLLASGELKPWGLPRGFVASAAVFGLGTLFLTYSRTLWVALPLGILCFVAWPLVFPPAPARPRWAALAGLGVTATGVLAALWAQPAIRARLTNGMGTTERENLWAANWEFFRARPLTGTGWHHNQEISGYFLMEKFKTTEVFSGHAHNVVLDLLGGTGLLGLAAWIFWMLAVMRPLWPHRLQTSRERALGVALLCAWGVFLINGLTQVNFWEAKVLHQTMWIAAWTLFWSGSRELVR